MRSITILLSESVRPCDALGSTSTTVTIRAYRIREAERITILKYLGCHDTLGITWLPRYEITHYSSVLAGHVSRSRDPRHPSPPDSLMVAMAA